MNERTNNQTQGDIALKALEAVIDPEIGLNIVDLGLIYEINFDESKSNINVLMTLTTQFCPLGDSISESVKQVLQNTFIDSSVDVELTYEPAWNQERISASGYKFLND